MGEYLNFFSAICRWWRETFTHHGFLAMAQQCSSVLNTFLRESMPSHRRQRYGDIDFDWDHRVDTTSATVGWRDRLLGVLNSPYQPTEESLFHQMISSLDIDFRNFTFIDIGSGKGRALLMASHYPFRRILGVELLPALHQVAEQNIAKYKNELQFCHKVESICADARDFVFPVEPIVLYLFNPLPADGLAHVLNNLERSLQLGSRHVYVLYHNAEHEHLLTESAFLQKIGGSHQYSLFSNSPSK